jgi:2-polyprenyl-3-methyl-5-hydroxy-6-metoxy-1,4-benzoquinol methylase
VDRSLYEEHARLEQDHWWFVARRAIVSTVLDRHLPAAAERRILDVGCGTGGMLPMLARFGTVAGLEAEPLAVDHCHATFPSFPVELGGIPDQVPTDGALSVITAFDVIEHIDDDHAAVASLRGAVHRDGTVVVTVPALQALWSDHDVVNGHKRRYDRRGLSALLRGADLELAHQSYFNTVLLPAVAAARVAQRVLPSPGRPESDFSMPAAPVNRILTRVFSSERSLVAGPGLPLGVSLIAVAHRRR